MSAVNAYSLPSDCRVVRIDCARQQRLKQIATGVRLLTKRESEVLAHMMAYQPTKVIAKLLGVKKATVYKHSSNLRRKLAAECNEQLLCEITVYELLTEV